MKIIETVKDWFKRYSDWLEDNPAKEKSLMTLAVILGAVGWFTGMDMLFIAAVVIGSPGIIAYVQRKLG